MKSNLPFSYFGCALIIRNPRAVISDHALPALELESAGHARGARRGIQGAFFIGAVSQFNNRGRFPCEARLVRGRNAINTTILIYLFLSSLLRRFALRTVSFRFVSLFFSGEYYCAFRVSPRKYK